MGCLATWSPLKVRDERVLKYSLLVADQFNTLLYMALLFYHHKAIS